MENQTTKSGKWIIATVISFVLGVVVMLLVAQSREPDVDESKRYIDSLMRQSRQTITFDSIRSAIERRLLDSIAIVRDEITAERIARRRETQIIRRETQRIRHRLDSIGPIERPDL